MSDKKIIQFSVPLHIVEGVTWNIGETKYRFIGLERIFSKMFYQLRSFFFESYTVGQSQTIVRESYLGIDKNGDIETRVKPGINDETEELKQNIGVSIQMFEPVNDNIRTLRAGGTAVQIVSNN